MSQHERGKGNEEVSARLDFFVGLMRPQFAMPEEVSARLDFFIGLMRPQFALPEH